MSVIEITSREFRDKQRTYFELADKGEKIIVKRGRNQSYLITPIQPGDITVSYELEAKIEKAKKQLKTGEATRIKGSEELKDYLARL